MSELFGHVRYTGGSSRLRRQIKKKAEAITCAATVAGKNGTPQMTYAILPAARLRSAPSKARRQNGIVIRGGYHFAAARLGIITENRIV